MRRFLTGVAVLSLGVVAAMPASMAAHAATAPAAAAAAPSSGTTNAFDRRTPAKHSANTVKKAAAPALTISVDNGAPAGKNWEYTHYFPEGQNTPVTLPAGSTVDFHWNTGSLNGLHTVTFSGTMTEAQYRAAHPVIAPDTNPAGEASTPDEQNPVNPSDVAVPSGGGAPGCGFGPTPCLVDNASAVTSGEIPTQVGADWSVTLAPGLTNGTVLTYFCMIHPNMSGQITIGTTNVTTPASAAAQSLAEYNDLNAKASAAEAAASVPTAVTNPDGTKTWTENVGLTADDVQILEMLPFNLPIAKGDTVKMNSPTWEFHTATFLSSTAPPPNGLAPFLPAVCEGVPPSSPDTAPAQVQGPPYTGCPPPIDYEQPFILGPQPSPAVHTIASGATSASTGVMTMVPGVQALGGPGTSYNFNFPNNGVYQYFCHFHQGMFGIISTPGYRLAGKDGGVFDFGGTSFFGSKGGQGINNIVAIVNTLDTQGYWLVGSDGTVWHFGDAPAYTGPGWGDNGAGGVAPKVKLNAPIVGAALTSDGGGLFLVGGDGGIFTLGNAVFRGSTGSLKLNKPVIGLAVSPDGSGYWLVATDGGVFSFGVPFFGSTGSLKLNKPVIGMLAVPDANGGPQGYYLFASDGGVFTFRVPFLGSLGSVKLNAPIVGLSLTVDFSGYRLVATDGGVFDFNAPFFGSLGSFKLNSPITAIAGI